MELRIDETAAGLSLGMGDALAIESHTKAHRIQLIGGCASSGIIPVEEAGEIK